MVRLVLCHCATIVGRQFLITLYNVLSSGSSKYGFTRSLDHWMVGLVLYHCATIVGQHFLIHFFIILSLLVLMWIASLRPLTLGWWRKCCATALLWWVSSFLYFFYFSLFWCQSDGQDMKTWPFDGWVSVIPLRYCSWSAVSYTSFIFLTFSVSRMGKTWKLDHLMVGLVLCHCATIVGEQFLVLPLFFSLLVPVREAWHEHLTFEWWDKSFAILLLLLDYFSHFPSPAATDGTYTQTLNLKMKTRVFYQGSLTEGNDSVQLTSLYLIVKISSFFKWTNTHLFTNTGNLNEEVDSTDPSPAVSILWFYQCAPFSCHHFLILDSGYTNWGEGSVQLTSSLS